MVWGSFVCCGCLDVGFLLRLVSPLVAVLLFDSSHVARVEGGDGILDPSSFIPYPYIPYIVSRELLCSACYAIRCACMLGRYIMYSCQPIKRLAGDRRTLGI